MNLLHETRTLIHHGATRPCKAKRSTGEGNGVKNKLGTGVTLKQTAGIKK